LRLASRAHVKDANRPYAFVSGTPEMVVCRCNFARGEDATKRCRPHPGKRLLRFRYMARLFTQMSSQLEQAPPPPALALATMRHKCVTGIRLFSVLDHVPDAPLGASGKESFYPILIHVSPKETPCRWWRKLYHHLRPTG